MSRIRSSGGASVVSITLFPIMTLESWSEAIARPVMAEYTGTWVYFITFILASAFTVLNLFIGIIVDSMQQMHADESATGEAASKQEAHNEREALLQHIEQLHAKIDRLEQRIAQDDGAGHGGR